MEAHSSGYANGKNNEIKGRRCIPYSNTLDDERKEISVVLCESEYGCILPAMLVAKDK
jgi:hypothetical protein